VPRTHGSFKFVEDLLHPTWTRLDLDLLGRSTEFTMVLVHSLAFVEHVDKYTDESTWAVIADIFTVIHESVLPKLPRDLTEGQNSRRYPTRTWAQSNLDRTNGRTGLRFPWNR